MSDRYIKLTFTNAKIFKPNKESKKDRVSYIEGSKNGYKVLSKQRDLKGFKEPITVYQLNNVLRTFIGERPIPSLRKTFYTLDKNDWLFNMANESFLHLDKVTYKTKKGDIREITETLRLGKSSYNSWVKPNRLHWFQIKRYMGEHYDRLISLLNEELDKDVTKEPFENLLYVFSDDKGNKVIDYLLPLKKTPLINYLTFDKGKVIDLSEISRGKNMYLTFLNGIREINIANGVIYVPFNETFYNKMVKTRTNILDGGQVKFNGIYDSYELTNTEHFIKFSNINNEIIDYANKD